MSTTSNLPSGILWILQKFWLLVGLFFPAHRNRKRGLSVWVSAAGPAKQGRRATFVLEDSNVDTSQIVYASLFEGVGFPLRSVMELSPSIGRISSTYLVPGGTLFLLLGIHRRGALGSLPAEWILYRVSWGHLSPRVRITETPFELMKMGNTIPLAGRFTLVFTSDSEPVEIRLRGLSPSPSVIEGSLAKVFDRLLEIEGTYGSEELEKHLFIAAFQEARRKSEDLESRASLQQRKIEDLRQWARVVEGIVDRAVVHVHDHVGVCTAGRRLTLLDAYLQCFLALDPMLLLLREANLDHILTPPRREPSPSEVELASIFETRTRMHLSERRPTAVAGR